MLIEYYYLVEELLSYVIILLVGVGLRLPSLHIKFEGGGRERESES